MIKLGIIGCGKIAQTRHLPEYATNPDAKLVGYYDKIAERAAQMAEKYGADALRFNLITGNSPGNDMRFYV